MRTTQVLAGATSIWLGILLCSLAHEALRAQVITDHPDTAPSIDAIREMAELNVLEVEATEIVTSEIKGHTGSTSVVVLVSGTLTYGIDLDKARYLQADPKQRHLILSIPQPEVRQVAIDPQKTQMLGCKRSGLWQLALGPAHEDKVYAAALTIGRDRFMQASAKVDLVSRARLHAEAVLGPFVSELGWTAEVRWEN